MQTVSVEWAPAPGVQAVLAEDQLQALFATVSISLQIGASQNGLAFDPAFTAGGYEALEAQLRPPANVFRPGVLILGTRPKSGDPTVLGETFGLQHGLCAVYTTNLTGANGFIDPLQLLHTSAHEIGHMCNLAHGFAALSIYSSVMVPANARVMPTATAWAMARQEAVTHGDSSWIDPPANLAGYPFNIVCRQQLTFQPSQNWRPWVGIFAGSGEGPGATHDQGVVLSAHPHRARCFVGDDLAFDVELISQMNEAQVLPLNVHPDFGTLDVTIEEPDGNIRRYTPRSHRCSESTWLLRRRERRVAPVSLAEDHAGPVLRQAGLHRVRLRLRAPGVALAANAGECRFEVIVSAASRHRSIPKDLRGLSKRRKANLLARARDGQDLGCLHNACMHGHHDEPDLAVLAEAPGAPRAVRHAAALWRAATAPAESRQELVEKLLADCTTAHDAMLRYKLMHFIHRKETP